jgi:hypothetical protein
MVRSGLEKFEYPQRAQAEYRVNSGIGFARGGMSINLPPSAENKHGSAPTSIHARDHKIPIA